MGNWRIVNLFSRLRASELVLLAYFLYVAILATFFPLPGAHIGQAWFALAVVVVLVGLLTNSALQVARDWIPLGLVLIAYREMDWFSVAYKARHLEQKWLAWDHRYFFDAGVARSIEAAGAAMPWLLEFCYLLVYGVGTFAVVAFYAGKHRERIDRFLIVYLIGTLASYALFPYFPSDPPRVVFPGTDLPHYITATRRLNLALVGGYGIHSSVFPSAHVSSAFSAAWGVLLFLPEQRWFGWVMLVYSALVAVATVYGRYHYAADAVAGIAISLIALAVGVRLRLASI